ncbi:MAG: LemA family protein [Acidobacteria bacterium]|nr:MAG: LemA family protein [Acidobacteriota bacterium]
MSDIGISGGSLMLLAIVFVLALVFVGLVAYFIGIYNNLVRLRNLIDRSFSDIDVVLKQRHDELPKLVETCKGYMQYEQKTLEAVIEARNAYSQAKTPGEKTQADNLVTGALRSLFALVEKYPDLKANANFIDLQHRITGLEDKIAAHRGLFNEDVNSFNIRIAQIPDAFIAGLMHLQPHPLFQAAEFDRADVEVKFT